MIKKAKPEDLKDLFLFKDLDSNQLQELSSFIKIKHYNEKEIVYYENDLKKQLYYLKSGHVKVYKVDRFDNEIFLYDIESDNMITKISSLEENSINCFGNIECVKPCEILIIDYESFKNFCLKNPKILLKVVEIFAKRNQLLECLINRELVYDGVAKVAYTLVNDIDSFNKLKKQEIAYRLNIQPETLSRILKKLIKRELIKSEHGIIEILDEEGLREIFE
ncbi:Crp/Fnr family transcriptional regulator [Nitrosophilus kaiyonis]|uniref:Crp/Fnr family transcriptional regulator n=1 Tax=Nitrosophilus kaiyonis TaxID=2930200 RepID=UPI002490F000|nr:Crp/Fnr family transcriptional regulator [Nitrosophilus kaiyonis]